MPVDQTLYLVIWFFMAFVGLVWLAFPFFVITRLGVLIEGQKRTNQLLAQKTASMTSSAPQASVSVVPLSSNRSIDPVLYIVDQGGNQFKKSRSQIQDMVLDGTLQPTDTVYDGQQWVPVEGLL